MNGKDTGFMIAGRKGRSLENEAVPVVVRPLRLMNVGTRSICSAVFHQPVIDQKLTFDSRALRCFVDYPARDVPRIGLIKPTAQMRISNHQIEAHGQSSNQERLDKRFGNQEVKELLRSDER